MNAAAAADCATLGWFAVLVGVSSLGSATLCVWLADPLLAEGVVAWLDPLDAGPLDDVEDDFDAGAVFVKGDDDVAVAYVEEDDCGEPTLLP